MKMCRVLVLILFFPGHAWSADALQIHLTHAKVTIGAGGVESMDSAATVKPGDIIEYSAEYTNRSSAPVTKVLATLPLPAETTLIADSPRPKGAEGSLNGAQFEAIPIVRPVTQAGGSTRQVPVALSLYRALRWSIPRLAPGQSVSVNVRVKVQNGYAEAPRNAAGDGAQPGAHRH